MSCIARQNNPNIILQPRDLETLQGLFECRIMTRPQIADIYFASRQAAAKQRLQKLKRAGFIAERKRSHPYTRVPLHITKKGFEALRADGRLRNFPSITWGSMRNRAYVAESTLNHELELMDFYAALHTHLRPCSTATLEQCLTWPRLFQFETVQRIGRRTTRPDGYIRIRAGDNEHIFFLELDRSTEKHATVLGKVRRYHAYLRSGDYARSKGARSEAEYRQHHFRLLIVVPTELRRRNLAQTFLNAGIRTLIWIGVFEEVLKAPVDAVWRRPIDYVDTGDPLKNHCLLP